MCPEAQFGYTENVGFAEYLLADPNYVARVPPGLSATELAPLICAGITTYKGIRQTGRNYAIDPQAPYQRVWSFSTNAPKRWVSFYAPSMMPDYQTRPAGVTADIAPLRSEFN